MRGYNYSTIFYILSLGMGTQFFFGGGIALPWLMVHDRSTREGMISGVLNKRRAMLHFQL